MDDKHEWIEPWLTLLQLINVFVRDGIGALAISAIAHLIEYAISMVEGAPWVWKSGGFELSASDVVRYGDLCILVAFIGIAVYNFVRRLAKGD